MKAMITATIGIRSECASARREIPRADGTSVPGGIGLKIMSFRKTVERAKDIRLNESPFLLGSSMSFSSLAAAISDSTLRRAGAASEEQAWLAKPAPDRARRYFAAHRRSAKIAN